MSFAPPRGPGKLDLAFNPVGLWTFDGNTNDQGTGGNNLSSTGTDSTAAKYTDIANGTQGLYMVGASQRFDTTVGTGNDARVSGDVTIQAVVFFSQWGIDSFGSRFFSVEGPGGSGTDENNLAKLMLADNTNRMTPRFSWESTNATQDVLDNNFSLVAGTWYHIVGVRESVGGGNADGRLYVNNQLITTSSAVPECDDGLGTIYVGIGESQSTNVQGCKKGTIISSAKLIDRALTPGEIASEWARVQGMQ